MKNLRELENALQQEWNAIPQITICRSLFANVSGWWEDNAWLVLLHVVVRCAIDFSFSPYVSFTCRWIKTNQCVCVLLLFFCCWLSLLIIHLLLFKTKIFIAQVYIYIYIYICVCVCVCVCVSVTPTPYNRKYNVLSASLNKTFPSFQCLSEVCMCVCVCVCVCVWERERETQRERERERERENSIGSLNGIDLRSIRHWRSIYTPGCVASNAMRRCRKSWS